MGGSGAGTRVRTSMSSQHRVTTEEGEHDETAKAAAKWYSL